MSSGHHYLSTFSCSPAFNDLLNAEVFFVQLKYNADRTSRHGERLLRPLLDLIDLGMELSSRAAVEEPHRRAGLRQALHLLHFSLSFKLKID